MDNMLQAMKEIEALNSRLPLSNPNKIIIDPNLVMQFRFPKSKRKRIMKKWTNDKRNFKPAWKMLEMNGVCVAHPSFMRGMDTYVLQDQPQILMQV